MAEHLIVVQAVEGSSPFIHPAFGFARGSIELTACAFASCQFAN